MNWTSVGAHLLSLQFLDEPLFYLAPESLQVPGKPARGGVPVMFPQFANRGPGPKHGLVRQQAWTCLVQTENAASFTLTLPPDTAQHWAGHARLTLSAALLTGNTTGEYGFSMRYGIENIGNQVFDFTGGLHPYFFVDDVEQVALQGLGNVMFEDRYQASGPTLKGFLTGQAFERLYLSAPSIVLVDGTRRVALSAQGFDNWMVWNPGAELALELTDMPAQDWRRFLCVEPIVAAKPVVLGPGDTFTGVMAVRRLA